MNERIIFWTAAAMLFLVAGCSKPATTINPIVPEADSKAQVNAATDIAIVLDCSRNMLEKIGDKRKIDLAKEAVKNLIGQLPEERRLAFIVYGHLEGKEHECDVEVKRPLGSLSAKDRAELLEFVDGLVPRGDAPIAKSLRLAGKELAKNKEGIHSLVLVTDGKETCGDKPEEAAEALTKKLNLKKGVTVVGLSRNDAEKEAAKRIAVGSKGEFYDGQKPDDVARIFKEGSQAGDSLRRVPTPPEETERAVRIVKPEMKELQKLEEIRVYEAGKYFPVIPRQGMRPYHYGDKIRLDAEEKIDIYWLGETGRQVPLVLAFSVKEEKVVNLDPAKYLGVLRIDAQGFPRPKRVMVCHPGKGNDIVRHWVQEAKSYREDLVLPVGRYDIVIESAQGDREKVIAERRTVKPGQINVVKKD